MKKMSKKIKLLSVIFVTALLCLAVKVDAAPFSVDTNSKITTQGTLTITGIESGDSFKAYKLLDAYYNETSNVVSYNFTTSFKAYLDSSTHSGLTVNQYFNLTGGSITSGETTSASELDEVVSGYVSYIKNHAVDGVDMTPNGNTVRATLEAGAYLVLPVSTAKVYAVMVGNLDAKAEGNNWVLNDATIRAKVSQAGITKTVSATEDKNLLETGLTYTVIGTVPQYPSNAINRIYKIEDTMSEGLSFKGLDTFKVIDGEIELVVDTNDGTVKNASGDTVATIVISDQKMTMNFDVKHLTSTTVTITYGANFNDNVVLGDAGNKNNAVLTYSNDPYGTGTYDTENDDVSEGEVVTQIYGIEVLQYEGTDKSKILEGATFDVYSDEDLTNKVGTITTDETGVAKLAGVIEGTYYLKETKAPAGYRLIEGSIEARVNVEGAVASSTEGYFVTEVSSVKNGILPFTGSSGLLLYSLLGILIIGIGSYITINNKKKKIVDVQE